MIETLTHVCVTVACDGCDNEFDCDYTTHFPDCDAAVSEVLAHGWTVAESVVRCPSCKARAECEARGHHAWLDWSPIQADQHAMTGERRRYVGRVRHCDHCGKPQYDPPLSEK